MGGHLPPWVNTLILPKFGGGCEIWKGGIEMGGAQMKYQECMRLGGSAAVSRRTFLIHEGCLENPKCTKCNSMQ